MRKVLFKQIKIVLPKGDFLTEEEIKEKMNKVSWLFNAINKSNIKKKVKRNKVR